MKFVIGRRSMTWAGILFLLAGGCAGPGGPPEPIEIRGTIAATEGLNPDVSGRPSPVVLRIYQLKAAGAFEAADFFALYRGDKALLGADLVAADELQLQPGQTLEYNAKFDQQAQFLGVIAAFRDIGNAQWRSVSPLPEDKLLDFFRSNRLSIAVDDLAVQVSFDRP